MTTVMTTAMQYEPSSLMRGMPNLHPQSQPSLVSRMMNFFPRGLFARITGGSFGGQRDLYSAFGWDYQLDNQMIWRMYARNGMARRITRAYADATWAKPPEVGGTQGFKKAWKSLVDDQNLWSIIHRLDVLTQLGAYAVLVVGLKGGGRISDPLPPGRTFTPDDILYLQPFSARTAVVTKWGQDPLDERFGLPVEYTVYPGLARQEDMIFGGAATGQPLMIPAQGSYRVHWSRVVHLNQGALENDVFGVPMIWSVWNYLTDLQKVVGGSAESYWLTANRGMQADVDKDMQLSPDDEASLAMEIQDYVDGMQRFIRTRGVTVHDLGSDVANPTGPFETLVTLISAGTGIPQRILVGSQAAHQASTQDKGSWAERVVEYRELTGVPKFVKPVALGFQRMGVLPKTSMSKIVDGMVWPEAYELSPLEKAQEANQAATAANNLAMAVQKVPNLMTVEEMRKAVPGLKLPEDGKVVDGTKAEAPVIGAGPDGIAGDGSGGKESGDGGVASAGTGSGNKSGAGSSASGKGAPRQTRGTTSK